MSSCTMWRSTAARESTTRLNSSFRKMVYASGVTSRDLVAEAVSKGRRGPEIGRVGTVRKVRRRKAVDRSYVQRERHDREDSDSVVLLDW